MLFLTGQFEAGIEILYRSTKFATHAVHIAIALNEQGLLALSDNVARPVRKLLYNIELFCKLRCYKLRN